MSDEQADRPEGGYEPKPGEMHAEKFLHGKDPVRGSSYEPPEDRISRRGVSQAYNAAVAYFTGSYELLNADPVLTHIGVEAFFPNAVPVVPHEFVMTTARKLLPNIPPDMRDHESGVKLGVVIGFILGWTTLNKIHAEYPLRMMEKFTEKELEDIQGVIRLLLEASEDDEIHVPDPALERVKTLLAKIQQVRNEYDPHLAAGERWKANAQGKAEGIWPTFSMANFVRFNGKLYELASFEKSESDIEGFHYVLAKDQD